MAQCTEVSSLTNSSITYLIAPTVADMGLAYHLFVCFTGFGLRQTICSFATTHLPQTRNIPMHKYDQKTEWPDVSDWIRVCVRITIPAVFYVSE